MDEGIDLKNKTAHEKKPAPEFRGRLFFVRLLYCALALLPC